MKTCARWITALLEKSVTASRDGGRHDTERLSLWGAAMNSRAGKIRSAKRWRAYLLDYPGGGSGSLCTERGTSVHGAALRSSLQREGLNMSHVPRLPVLTLVFLLSVTSTESLSKLVGAEWGDSFYQYRIPLEVQVETPGWNRIPVTAEQVSTAISELEEYSFIDKFLAYDQLEFRERGLDGGSTGLLPIHYHLVPTSGELVSSSELMPIPTERDAFYLVEFASVGGVFPPTVGYEQVFPIGDPVRNHAYHSSYVPRLLPKASMHHECLLQSDGTDLTLRWDPRQIKQRHISVRRCELHLLGHFQDVGRHLIYLYYQPTDAHYLKIPRHRRERLPASEVAMVVVGSAEKYLGDTQYRLNPFSAGDVWFADTTVKLTPQTPAPAEERSEVHIQAAANESQSFQIVINPAVDFRIDQVAVTKLSQGPVEIAPAAVEIRQVDYVRVSKAARINQVRFFGEIGDPLIAVEPQEVVSKEGNLAFWLTIRVPSGSPGGDYRGSISFSNEGETLLAIPLHLTVYNFELPEFSPFRSNMGGQYFAKNSGDAKLNPTYRYHGIQSKEGLKKLAKAYYEIMAREKFYPKNVALFAEIGVVWDLPPDGLNVDAPGNYFTLREWDFREFNSTLRHFIDELKVNSVCLTHTNPSVSHIFKHLPGETQRTWNSDPGHITMAWQTFRKMTQITYLKEPHDPWQDSSLEVTRAQWDHLVLEYYRALCGNLRKHGWLDKFYIFVDETAGTEKILHLARLLKKDPQTAGLRIAHCLQGFESLWHEEDGDYVFRDLLTHVPQIDENYYRWEDYYWKDYDVPRDRNRLWSYAAYSSRLGINVPGMSNRQIGLELFHLGGSGYVIWDTLMWHHHYGDQDDPHNPWQEPHASLANGALAYFYPPQRDGLAVNPDLRITPSLRVMTFREAVDDFEYAYLLEGLVADAERAGVTVPAARRVLDDIERMFPNSVSWSLNDAWYLELRQRMAHAIENLRERLQ